MAKAATEIQTVTVTWNDLLVMLKNLGDPNETRFTVKEEKELFIETKKQFIAGLDTLNQPVRVDTGPQVNSFFEDANFNTLINDFCNTCRDLASDPHQPKFVRDNCKRIIDFLSANAQLLGWQHVSCFMNDPLRYVEMNKAVSRGKIEADGALGLKVSANQYRLVPLDKYASAEMTGLIEKGKYFLGLLMQRVDTILRIRNQIEPATQRPSLGDTIAVLLKIFQADVVFFEKITKFMKDAEQTVTTMINSNPNKFAQFRELQSKGVAWPHSPQLRREIEAACFVFRPMMIKRDRCVCDTCGVEVSGWRAWHNPWTFHDLSRHPGSKPIAEKLAKRKRDFDISQDSEALFFKENFGTTPVVATTPAVSISAFAPASAFTPVVPAVLPVATPAPAVAVAPLFIRPVAAPAALLPEPTIAVQIKLQSDSGKSKSEVDQYTLRLMFCRPEANRPNTLQECTNRAEWYFDLRLQSYAMPPNSVTETVSKQGRMLLMHNGVRFPYGEAIDFSGPLQPDNPLNLQAVVLRSDPAESDPNALAYARNISYCKVLPSHDYQLNLNFCGKQAKEALEQKLGAGHQFCCFMTRTNLNNEIEVQPFTTFSVHWLNGVEAGPDAHEKSRAEKRLAETAKRAADPMVAFSGAGRSLAKMPAADPTAMLYDTSSSLSDSGPDQKSLRNNQRG